MSTQTLESIRFDNTVLNELPLDPQLKNYTRQVANACFSLVDPEPVVKPKLVGYSEDALRLLGITPEESQRPDFPEFFSGNKKLNGSQTAAHCYCGHQFGNFAGQLGDGRAMYLGEILNNEGERWELQLKGAGKTPYSREADGRAVLRSSIREFLCSEAMHHLGVPTTRAGSIITSETFAIRDPLYDGNPIREHCAIVSRIAQSFIRFGSFQVARTTDKMTGRAGPSPKNFKLVMTLIDYVIKHHFPEIAEVENQEERYKKMLGKVAQLTAKMVAGWQTVGFAHGVMNTDNMSILGLTIDYGPYGWLEYYDPNYICNHSDHEGRYAFGNQVSICKWNLEQLAEAIFVSPNDSKVILRKFFDQEYEKIFHEKMTQKLGLFKTKDRDATMIKELLHTLEETCADMTNVFRSLSQFNNAAQIDEFLPKILSQCSDASTWLEKQKPTMPLYELQMYMRLPADVLASVGKSPEMLQKQVALLKKYHELQGLDDAQKKAQDEKAWRSFLQVYADRLSAEFEGMSDEERSEAEKKRIQSMNSVNPKFVLRNHLAQDAIEAAEEGDFTEFWSLYNVLKTPFDEHDELAGKQYDRLQPVKAAKCVVSCSS